MPALSQLVDGVPQRFMDAAATPGCVGFVPKCKKKHAKKGMVSLFTFFGGSFLGINVGKYTIH